MYTQLYGVYTNVSVHAKIRTSNNIFQKRLVRLILFGNFAK